MRGHNLKTYYALVWNNVLNEQVKLKGKRVNQGVKLPNGPRMLYGTNDNDVFKIVKEVVHKKIKYDVFTTKQSVKFYIEKVEYVLPRDVRIIVWEGESELFLPSGSYRVMSPQMFENLTKEKIERENVLGEGIRLPRNFTSVLQATFA